MPPHYYFRQLFSQLPPSEQLDLEWYFSKGESKVQVEDWICDILGPFTSWPDHLLYKLFCEKLSYKNRIKVIGFLWMNGLRICQIVYIIFKCNPFPVNWRKIIDLFYYFDRNIANCHNRYYSFDLITKEYVFFNGVKRIANGQKRNHKPVVVSSDGRHVLTCDNK